MCMFFDQEPVEKTENFNRSLSIFSVCQFPNKTHFADFVFHQHVFIFYRRHFHIKCLAVYNRYKWILMGFY